MNDESHQSIHQSQHKTNTTSSSRARQGRNTSFNTNSQFTMAPQTQAKPRQRNYQKPNSDVMELGETEGENHESSDENDGPAIKPILYSSNSKALLPPTQSLPLLVFIDMFAVSLVVPLLFQYYYQNAGVTSANQRELLSSVFSSSQIVGGLVLSALADARILRRKTILFLSFGGSSVSYALVAYGGFRALIVSRVLVGLVKQTMTVTTSMLTKCTTPDNRAKYIGRLESSSTAAWIAGPSVGAILYKYVDHKAPALLACVLFMVNFLLAAILIRGDDDDDGGCTEPSKKPDGPKTSFWANLKSCFSSKALGSVIASILIYSWVNKATSYSSMGGYYEDMYGAEPHHRGYIQSYRFVLGFLVQSALVGPVLKWVGGERKAACLAALLIAITTFCEMHQSFPIFLLALIPAIELARTMLKISLRALLTTVAPGDSIFSIFAALDVLQNVTQVTVPFYRTTLFKLLGGGTGKRKAGMEGDPDPVAWVFSGGLHWGLAAAAMSVLLLPNGRQAIKTNLIENQ